MGWCDDEELKKGKLTIRPADCDTIGIGCQDFDYSDEYNGIIASGTKCCCDTDL